MASKSYGWNVRNIAKISPKMVKKGPFFDFRKKYLSRLLYRTCGSGSLREKAPTKNKMIRHSTCTVFCLIEVLLNAPGPGAIGQVGTDVSSSGFTSSHLPASPSTFNVDRPPRKPALTDLESFRILTESAIENESELFDTVIEKSSHPNSSQLLFLS